VFLPSSSGRTRTYDPAVNSRLLYQLSYRGMYGLGLCLHALCNSLGGQAFALTSAKFNKNGTGQKDWGGLARTGPTGNKSTVGSNDAHKVTS
jgi:hypothetical protein